jgi:hypothetical protein
MSQDLCKYSKDTESTLADFVSVCKHPCVLIYSIATSKKLGLTAAGLLELLTQSALRLIIVVEENFLSDELKLLGINFTERDNEGNSFNQVACVISGGDNRDTRRNWRTRYLEYTAQRKKFPEFAGHKFNSNQILDESLNEIAQNTGLPNTIPKKRNTKKKDAISAVVNGSANASDKEQLADLDEYILNDDFREYRYFDELRQYMCPRPSSVQEVRLYDLMRSLRIDRRAN